MERMRVPIALEVASLIININFKKLTSWKNSSMCMPSNHIKLKPNFPINKSQISDRSFMLSQSMASQR
jgi:hypothetical protein